MSLYLCKQDTPSCINHTVSEVKKFHRAVNDSKAYSNQGINTACDYAIKKELN